ncbi:hypothetical protein [Pseudomonas citronellolis]|uniref:hypothetical protein n=1 Tax=Pseudomonas citronellolis TaxID=53408 RepID=UPI003C2DD1C7
MLIAFVLVMLFVRGPIEQVASGLPAAVQAQVAFRRIAAVLADFTQYEPDLLSERPTGVFPALQALELRDVSYTHLDSAGQPTFQTCTWRRASANGWRWYMPSSDSGR